MEIVYDIELNDGEVLKGCYFIEYERKVYGGFGNVHVATVPDHNSCFIENEEVKNKNFNDCNILKIYDNISGTDLSERSFADMLINGNRKYSMPVARERIVLE